MKLGGGRGHISAPAWAWELVGWLLLLAILVTTLNVLLNPGN